MRVAVLSDLHREFNPWVPPPIEADVVVLAGDIDVLGNQADVPAWARRSWPSCEILYVQGNHEYYGFSGGMEVALVLARRLAKNSAVHLLESDSVVINDVRFLGCTLWTDFELRGSPQASMETAARAMNDFRIIRVDNGEGGTEPFAPQDSLQIHRQSVAWLDTELAKPFDGEDSGVGQVQQGLWRPKRSTVAYIGETPIGLTVFEMTVNLATRDYASGRICLQAYAPYETTQWSQRWRERGKVRLDRSVPEIIGALQEAAAAVQRTHQETLNARDDMFRPWDAGEAAKTVEEIPKQVALAQQASRDDLLQVVNAWSEAKKLRAVIQELEVAASQATRDDRERLLERIRLVKEFIGEVDALGVLLRWKSPQEHLSEIRRD